MYDPNTTISDFLSAAASKQPTPGGGSVTALAGALAAAMGEMVLNYSIGKKNLAPYDAELRAAVSELYNVRVNLPDLTDQHDRPSARGECDKQLAHATHAVARAVGRIWSRHARGE